jgi:predicted metal-dependent RNase
MSQIDYSLMSDAELRQFFLQNRQDQTAFEAYMDRLNQRPRKIIASPGDPDFDQKIQAAIRRKLEGSGNSSLSINVVEQTE